MEFTYHYHSPLGGITLASNGSALTGLWFDGQKYFSASLDPHAEERLLPVFEETIQWLDLYFGGQKPDFLPALELNATEFRKTVWNILLTIPYGQTMTYGAIAKQVASIKGVPHMSAQAVGGAVGHNPISIIVPCHRVIGADGSLTGYAGGISKKRKLLELEKGDWNHIPDL